MSKFIRFLPVIIFVVVVGTWLATYFAAIAQSHVEGAFPYISELATTPPESGTFGQFMNIGSILVAIFIYIRYLQVDEIATRRPELPSKLSIINVVSMWFGAGISLGLSVVANFQTSNWRYLHVTGGGLFFLCACIYCALQTFCCFSLHRFTGSPGLARLRLILTIIIVVCTIILVHTQRIANAAFKGEDTRKWFPEDGGYDEHVVSAISQWIDVFAICFFVLSFSGEFRHLSFSRPQVVILQERLTSVKTVPGVKVLQIQ